MKNPLVSLFAILALALAAFVVAASCGERLGFFEPAAVTSPSARPAELFSFSGSYLSARLANRANLYGVAAGSITKSLTSPVAGSALPALRETALKLNIGAGNFAEATGLSADIVKENPNHLVARLVLLVDRLKAEDYQGARQQWTHLPKREALNLVPMILDAWISFGEGDVRAAEAALAPLAKPQTTADFYLLHKALLLDAAGDSPAAAELGQRLMQREYTLPLRAVESLNGIFAHAKADDLQNRLLDAFAQHNSDPLRFSVATGEAQARKTSAAGAGEALYDFSSLLLGERAMDGALIYGQLALMADPEMERAHLLIAEIMHGARQYDVEQKHLARITPKSPYYLHAQIQYARSLERQDKRAPAIARLQALLPQSDHPQILTRLADLLRLDEKYAEAIPFYTRALEGLSTESSDRWGLYFARGLCYDKTGRWDLAEKDFTAALDINPDESSVLNYLGYSWVERKQNLPEALDLLKRAVAADPNNPYIIDSLGWAYYRVGDFENAADYLETAVELRPIDSEMNDHLGDVYKALGRKREAVFQWERALQFSESEAFSQKVQTKLRDFTAADES